MEIERHLSAIETSGQRLVDLVLESGLEAPIPTCPAWDARALLAHQAMVHRWATAHVGRTDPDDVPSQTYLRESVGDLPGYYRDGLAALVTTLREAPDDLEAMRFLADPPPARQFWARRQAHETTIHMVDALASTTGRFVTASEAALPADLAADGIDELLAGFLPRGKSKLFGGTTETLLVSTTDTGDRWLLRVGESNVTERDPAGADADFDVTGSAAQVYLGLWNRGKEMRASSEWLARWQSAQRVRWS